MIAKETKLRFWCQKVLPAVYDDALSYYELLAKVVKHLNDHADAINELIEFYNNFQGDLDEIIQQMIDSGEFDEIFISTFSSVILPATLTGETVLD